jgi:hypothetical protein
MALEEFLILSRPRSGRVEGRKAPIQAWVNSFSVSQPTLPVERRIRGAGWTADIHTRFLRKLSTCSRRPALPVQKSRS